MTADQIRNTLYDLEDLENYEEKSAKLHMLLRKLRGLNEEELEFDVRVELMNTYYHIYSDVEEEMANFAWLLQYEEKHPDYYTTQLVMWYYKWMAIRLITLPHVPLEKSLALLKDMEERYTQRHYGLRAVYSEYRDLYILMGDVEKATEYFLKEKESDETSMDDCYACQLNGNLDYYMLLEDYEKVLENAKPLLNREYTCGRVPQSTYPDVVEAYMQLRDWEKVEKYTEEGFQVLENDFSFVNSLITFMLSYALLGRFSDAKRMMELSLDKVLSKRKHFDMQSISTSIEIFMEILAVKGETEIHLSPSLHSKLSEIGLGGYSIREFKQFFGKKTREIRKQFDQRNGNSYYMDEYMKKWKLVEDAPCLQA